MKRKRIGISIVVIGMIVALSYMAIDNLIVFVNNQKLKYAVTAIKSNNVKFNEIIPFNWDVVYTFTPYMSKEEVFVVTAAI